MPILQYRLVKSEESLVSEASSTFSHSNIETIEIALYKNYSGSL